MLKCTNKLEINLQGVCLINPMNSEHLPSAVGITGLLGTITLSDINNMVAIAVGATTLFYLGVKIFKELRKG